MTALTLTQAAEKLAPVFDDTQRSDAPLATNKTGEMTLESAAAMLTERLNGERSKPAVEPELKDEPSDWDAKRIAEDDAFKAGRPGWSDADSQRAVAFLLGLGMTVDGLRHYWANPEPIDINGPFCSTLAKMVAGNNHEMPIEAALAAVGFDADEIDAVSAGEKSIFLRDHRIQELIARAIDANSQGQNQEAA